jgi:hypothetical protein
MDSEEYKILFGDSDATNGRPAGVITVDRSLIIKTSDVAALRSAMDSIASSMRDFCGLALRVFSSSLLTWDTHLWKRGDRSVANSRVNLLSGRMQFAKGASGKNKLELEILRQSDIVRKTANA